MREQIHSGGANLVVRIGGDDPGDEGTVPRAGSGGKAAARAVDHPVALVARIGIAGVVVARAPGVADEVVARENPAREIGVHQDAGVDHRDRGADGCLPQLQVPSRGYVDARDRIPERPLLRVQRIVGDELRVLAQHRVGILDCGVCLKLEGEFGQPFGGLRLCEPQHPHVADLALGRKRNARLRGEARQQVRPVGDNTVREPHHQLVSPPACRARCRIDASADRRALAHRLGGRARHGHLGPKHRPVAAQGAQRGFQIGSVTGLGERQFETTGPGRAGQCQRHAGEPLEAYLLRRRQCARGGDIGMQPDPECVNSLGQSNIRNGGQQQRDQCGAEPGAGGADR